MGLRSVENVLIVMTFMRFHYTNQTLLWDTITNHMPRKCDKTNISCISKGMETGKLNFSCQKNRMYVLSRICMYTGWYPMQKSFPFSIWFLFWWLTLYYKVRLANNGPLYDMILVWSKCDFFRSARIMVMIGETKCPDWLNIQFISSPFSFHRNLYFLHTFLVFVKEIGFLKEFWPKRGKYPLELYRFQLQFLVYQFKLTIYPKIHSSLELIWEKLW